MCIQYFCFYENNFIEPIYMIDNLYVTGWVT
jgi:hypothetical protein